MRYLLLFTSCFLFSYTLKAQWSFSTLSQAKGDIAAIRIKNRLFFTGGALDNGGPASRKVEIYDGTTGNWTVEEYSSFYSASNMISATSAPWAIFARGSYTLTVITFVYNDNTKTWTTTDFPSNRFNYTIGILGNKAYFAGGSVGNTASKTVDIYDFTTNKWSKADLLSEARNNISIVTVGQKIFFIGGDISEARNQFSNAVDVYDASTDSWSAFTLSQARKDMGIALVGNKIIVAGGKPSNTSSISLMSKKVDIIDVATNMVTTTTDLPEPNYNMTSVVIGNKVIFAGGGRNKAEILDVSTSKWQSFTLTTASENLFTLKSAKIGNKAFFAGGSVNDAKTVFIYDADSNTWSTYTLPVAQLDPAMMALDNKVIIAGGRTTLSSPFYTNQVSVFTDATVVGVPQVEPESSLKITPNPSTGLYNLDWLTTDQPLNARVLIHGFDGRKMLENTLQNNQLNLTQFAPGIYHVQIYADKRIWYKTLVKQ